jgi:hypothetical protein
MFLCFAARFSAAKHRIASISYRHRAPVIVMVLWALAAVLGGLLSP